MVTYARHRYWFFKDCKIYENDDSRTILKSASDINASDLIDIDCVVHLAGILMILLEIYQLKSLRQPKNMPLN